MKIILLLISLILCVACSPSSKKLTHVEKDIQQVNIKVNQLQMDIDALRQEVQAAKEAAERVNIRLDEAGEWPNGFFANPPRY